MELRRGESGATAAEALASAALQSYSGAALMLLSEKKGDVAGGSVCNVHPGIDMYTSNTHNSRRIWRCFSENVSDHWSKG